MRALSIVSSKYPKCVPAISGSRIRSSLHDGSNLSIRDLTKLPDFENNLLLMLSRSVVMSAADEVYSCIARSCPIASVHKNTLIHHRFFSGFVSCIRGYKQAADAMCCMRQQGLLRSMRRLQGGLLISKVYVNCLVRNFFLMFCMKFCLCGTLCAHHEVLIRCASIYRKICIKWPFIVQQSIQQNKQQTRRIPLYCHRLHRCLPPSHRISNSGGFLIKI